MEIIETRETEEREDLLETLAGYIPYRINKKDIGIAKKYGSLTSLFPKIKQIGCQEFLVEHSWSLQPNSYKQWYK